MAGSQEGRVAVHRIARGTWILALLLGGEACQSPTSSAPTPVAVTGQWTYSAIQTSPIAATLAGTLTIAQQSGPDFEGSLDATQQDALGNVIHVSGVISGQVLNASALEFSVFVGLAGRQHLGTLARDSVRGAWVEQTGAEVTSSGSFVAVRKSGP